MNRLFLSIFLISLMPITVFSQSCLPEGITFTTQEQIDNFQIDNPGCTEIEGDVIIYGDDIANLNGLSVITTIGGELVIKGNPILNDLTGLSNLFSIGGNAYIGEYYAGVNQALTSLEGLEGLTSVGGWLLIQYNDALTSLSGLVNLTSIEGILKIYKNPALTTLTGLDNIISIGGIAIHLNTSLTSIAALNNITSMVYSLSIQFNDSLTTLTGLDNVIHAGEMYISHNTSLNSIAALNNITSVAQNLSIKDNDSLTTLTGLDNLNSVGGSLAIEHIYVLTDITALNNLTSIGKELIFYYNTRLTSLTGLDNLTSIGTTLWIWGHYDLTSLSGLDNIEAGSIRDLYIYENWSLSTCEVQSVCDYLVSPGGTIEIHDNAPGCNSQAEVEAACVSFIEDVSVEKPISIYPNPFSHTTTIEYELKQPEKVSLTIYDYLGKQIEVIHEKQSQGMQKVIWIAEGLPDGIYYYRIQLGNQVANGKMVKVR